MDQKDLVEHLINEMRAFSLQYLSLLKTPIEKLRVLCNLEKILKDEKKKILGGTSG